MHLRGLVNNNLVEVVFEAVSLSCLLGLLGARLGKPLRMVLSDETQCRDQGLLAQVVLQHLQDCQHTESMLTSYQAEYCSNWVPMSALSLVTSSTNYDPAEQISTARIPERIRKLNHSFIWNKSGRCLQAA